MVAAILRLKVLEMPNLRRAISGLWPWHGGDPHFGSVL